ncbi:MAG: diguanylate cyclase response regulator [Elusimicrobia bacterium]|nr:MAG: diguanylate cyclase response regulator [Elusimicrobiota bacterium]
MDLSPKEAGRLVVADDQPDLLSLMKDALEIDGYEVRTAENGQEALDLVHEDAPDCVILDLFMPVKDGFEVCRELKSDIRYLNLPVILLSAAGQQDNRIQGLDNGADDFLVKPIEIVELLARIRMIMRRNRQGLDANPLTRLPGNVTIQSKIAGIIAEKKPLAVLYFDLNNFKAYNDAYGFADGDKVLKKTSQLLIEAVQKVNQAQDFVGHIGGDDFIIVSTPDHMEAIAKDVCDRFDELAPSFYNEDDRKNGKLKSKDRQGNDVEFPLLGIAVGVCHNLLKPLKNFAEVSGIGAELKKHAKRVDKSHYEIDRRQQ